MNKQKLIFFFDDFHQGAVNHVIHFVGFTILAYGLGKASLFIIIVPLQLLAWLVFVLLGYLLSTLLF